MKKWEYCFVGPISGPDLGGRYTRFQYMAETAEEVNLTGRDGVNIRKTIQQLGNDGWEMVGCGNVTELSHFIYFKRPKAK